MNKVENEAGDTNEVSEEAAEDKEEKEQQIISGCNLNWRFIVKPESKSPIP